MPVSTRSTSKKTVVSNLFAKVIRDANIMKHLNAKSIAQLSAATKTARNAIRQNNITKSRLAAVRNRHNKLHHQFARMLHSTPKNGGNTREMTHQQLRAGKFVIKMGGLKTPTNSNNVRIVQTARVGAKVPAYGFINTGTRGAGLAQIYKKEKKIITSRNANTNHGGTSITYRLPSSTTTTFTLSPTGILATNYLHPRNGWTRRTIMSGLKRSDIFTKPELRTIKSMPIH